MPQLDQDRGPGTAALELGMATAVPLPLALPSNASGGGVGAISDRAANSSGRPAGTDFIEDVRSFSRNGRRTECFVDSGIPYFVNEFWTRAQRRAHPLHEISYRACFKAQLPEFFISRLTEPGDWVHDPFMGRGTTPLQAALMGRRACGNDINPISRMLVRPRLDSICIREIATALDRIEYSTGIAEPEHLFAFYHPETLADLNGLRNWIDISEAGNETAPLGRVADWIRMVALNRLSGHSRGFFSGRSMPPNQAVSLESQQRINERLRTSPPRREVPAIILKKSASLLRRGSIERRADRWLFCGEADSTPEIPDGSVRLVVTSPPFLDVVDYATDNWLRCWFVGIDASKLGISRHQSATSWTAMVRRVLREQARILAPGGHVAFEVGEVRKKTILLERMVWEAAEGLLFERLGVLVNDQKFTKTANCWGVANNSKGTNTNRIVVLRRI